MCEEKSCIESIKFDIDVIRYIRQISISWYVEKKKRYHDVEWKTELF